MLTMRARFDYRAKEVWRGNNCDLLLNQEARDVHQVPLQLMIHSCDSVPFDYLHRHFPKNIEPIMYL